jgi:hypothetical protein
MCNALGPSIAPAHQALSHIDTISCMVLDPVEQQRFRGLVPERAGSDAGYQISSRTPLKEGWRRRPSPVLPRSSASTRTRGLTLGLGKARAGCPKSAVSVSAGFKPIQRNGSAVRPRSRCSGAASIESSRPGRIEVVATSTSGGLLVLHDTYYPAGLRRSTDGQHRSCRHSHCSAASKCRPALTASRFASPPFRSPICAML